MIKKRTAGLAAAALLAALWGAGAGFKETAAYLTDSRRLVNHLEFAGEQGLDAVLTEPLWKPENGSLAVPGSVLPKDPQVTNTSRLDMDELVALRVEFVYTENSPEGKEEGELLSREDMERVAEVLMPDYNADNPEKADWVRFSGQKHTDASQCFYYRKTLERQMPGEGETTVPLFTCVKLNQEVGNETFQPLQELGGVGIRICGHVIQQMPGERYTGLNSAEEAYEAGLFDNLITEEQDI